MKVFLAIYTSIVITLVVGAIIASFMGDDDERY